MITIVGVDVPQMVFSALMCFGIAAYLFVIWFNWDKIGDVGYAALFGLFVFGFMVAGGVCGLLMIALSQLSMLLHSIHVISKTHSKF